MINNFSKDISKKEKKVNFNIGENSHKKSQKPESSKCSTLTDSINKNVKDTHSHMEKTLLLTELKEKNRFKFTNRFSVLTNLRMILFYSKETYLLNMKNPYKIYELKDYNFELDKTLLIIKSKEEKESKEENVNVYIYEFADEDISLRWYNSIISSIEKMNTKKNENPKDNDYNSIKEENNELNESENQSYNLHIYDEYEESINVDKIKLNESKIVNGSENNEQNIKSSNIKKINSEKDKKEIITKPSFRFLLKEEINKIGNKETEYNLNTKENDFEEEKSINSKKNNNKVLSSVNSNNKNIYSFGKKNDFFSFHSKLDNLQSKIKSKKEKEEIQKNDNINDEEKNNINNMTNNDELDITESNTDFKIKDLSQNNITQNDLFNDKKSFINEENTTNISHIQNEDKSSMDIIKLISCEKESKSKSEINFELSDSNQKNNKKEKDQKSSCYINDFTKPDRNKNKIRSTFLSNTNNNSNQKEKNENKKEDNSDISCFSKISDISDNVNESKNEDENKKNKKSIKYTDFQCSDNSIFNLNENLTNINNKNDLDEINNIKMFDTPPQSNLNNYDKSQSLINNSLFNTPKVNNFDLDSNSNEEKKIFLFSNESNKNNDCNKNNNLDSSNIKLDDEKINIQNDLYNDGNSIIIIDKNNSLLTQFAHYENIINNKIAKYSKGKQICLEKSSDNFNIIDKKEEKSNLPKNDSKYPKNSNNKLDNNEIQNIECLDLIGKKNIINKTNNKLLIKNHFEFQYPPHPIIEYNNNNFVNIKDNSIFQTQKIVNFKIENWKKYINNCYFQIKAQSPECLLKEKKKNIPFRNNSSDKTSSNICYNNYINELKFMDKDKNKNIYQKNYIRKNMSAECNKYPKKFRNLSIEKNTKSIISFNNSDDSINPSEISKIIKLKNNNYFFNQYEKKKIKNVKKYINKNNEIRRYESYDNNYIPIKKPKEKAKNLKKYEKYINVAGNIYDNRRKQGNSSLEKPFDYNENNNNGEKINTTQLFENIISIIYSKKILLYCLKEGMETTTLIPKFQDILEKMMKSNIHKEINLKYLFENIPKIIRDRLQKKNLNIIKRNSYSNYINHLNNLNCKNNPYYESNNIDEEFNKAKEGIKKLIINDNKFIVNILSKSYDNLCITINKNILYKYKEKFIDEMKKLNEEIISS